MDELPASLDDDRLGKFLGAVGGALKATREQRQMSVYQLGRLTGLDERGIHRIERGETVPTLETVLRLTIALGIRLSSLITMAEQEADLDGSEWPLPEPR